MGKKGIRPKKGQPETDWGEAKTAKLNIGLTPTGKQQVKERANQLGISVSEVLERWARGVSVDDDDAIVAPSDPIPSGESILKALPRLSKQQIGRIVRAGLDLLAPPDLKEDETELQPVNEKPNTFEDAISNWDLEELADDALIPYERLIEIVHEKEKPNNDELIGLAASLELKPSELLRLIEKRECNGESQPNGH